MKTSILTKTLRIALLIYWCGTTANAQFAWATNLGGSGIDDTQDMVVDDAGNSYIVGEFNSSDATFGNFVLVGEGNFAQSDVFVAKYNTNGEAQWAIAFQGVNQDQATGIDLDAQGNIYVTGIFFDSIMIGTSLLTNAPFNNAYNGFIAKLDNNGNFIWAQQIAGATNSIFDIAVHDNGDFYICGEFNTNINLGGSSFNAIGNNGNTYVAKYNSNGQFLWLDQQFGTSGGGQSSAQYVKEVAISADGLQVYTAGWFYGTVTWGGVGGIMVSHLGDQENPFLARYDSTGNIGWVKRFGAYQLPTLNSGVRVNDLVVKSNGDPIILVQFGGGIIFNDVDSVRTDPTINNSAWHYESFLASYDSAGTYQWRSIIIGDEAEAVDMAIDGDDNIYLTGNVDGDINFGAVQHTQQTGSPFAVKFNETGTALSSVTTNVLGDPDNMEIGVDGGGNMYMSGVYFSGATFPPLNLNSIGSLDVYLAKTGTSTSINNASAAVQLSIFPNPAMDAVQITLVDVSGEVEVNIYSISGELVETNHLIANGESTTAKIDLPDLPNGPYLVEVSSGDKRRTEMVIIAR